MQEALEARQEAAVLVVGRLVAFGCVGRDSAKWLVPQLLSHFVAHGKRVEAAIKEIAK